MDLLENLLNAERLLEESPDLLSSLDELLPEKTSSTPKKPAVKKQVQKKPSKVLELLTKIAESNKNEEVVSHLKAISSKETNLEGVVKALSNMPDRKAFEAIAVQLKSLASKKVDFNSVVHVLSKIAVYLQHSVDNGEKIQQGLDNVADKLDTLIQRTEQNTDALNALVKVTSADKTVTWSNGRIKSVSVEVKS